MFGGGHVVLPLLQAAVVPPGWVDARRVPGRLWRGAGGARAAVHLRRLSRRRDAAGAERLAGASLCLVAIFLPGLLLLIGALPFWDALRRRGRVQAAMRGVNAAVVGLLLAALYNPVWTSAVAAPSDFAIALTGFALLTIAEVPPLVIVMLLAAGGIIQASLV